MNNNGKDLHTEIWIGNLLRLGILLACLVVAVGGIIFLLSHGNETSSFQVFQKKSELFTPDR